MTRSWASVTGRQAQKRPGGLPCPGLALTPRRRNGGAARGLSLQGPWAFGSIKSEPSQSGIRRGDSGETTPNNTRDTSTVVNVARVKAVRIEWCSVHEDRERLQLEEGIPCQRQTAPQPCAMR
jgi:hypothetical protein